MSRGWSLTRTWRTSLQVRTVVSTVLVTVLVVSAAGYVLVQRVASGLLEAKQISGLAEAAAGRSIARSYAETTFETDNGEIISSLVGDLADRAGKPPAYDVILQADPDLPQLPSDSTELVSIAAVPPELVDAMRTRDGPVWMSTDIAYSDGRVEPGLIVAAPVNVRGIGPYELYYLFGLEDVMRTISLVRSTVLAVGVVLVIALGAIAWWFSRRLVRPVQQASRTAVALSRGDLSRRIRVHGEDDMARLATSFNTMADSLQDQIERLRQLSEMQRRFVADVSHELRTPLTTIRMAADVVHEDAMTGQPLSRRTTELLVAEVDRFDELLNDLLEVSRFDAGEAVLDAEDVDLRALVRVLADSLRPVAAEHGCDLVVAGPETCRIEVDSRRIGRVLRNLVVNAIEHGAGHPVEVEVRCGAREVRVAVVDHGVGLQPQDAPRVFERFWRADPSRRRTLGGTGLGLAISREDARLHGGDLTVTSEAGRGCRFTLTLPRASTAAPDPESSPAEAVDV